MAPILPRCERKNLSARKADYQKFEELNVQILRHRRTLPFSQKTFADSLKLPYPLLSDSSMKTTKAYGVESGAKVQGRSFFLIDKQGIVRGRVVVRGRRGLFQRTDPEGGKEITGKP